MKAWLGIEADSLTTNELIRELLKADVELIYNGGIGTYIKAASESHADVRDKANDEVRVNGGEMRAKVLGEGGNLGATQLAASNTGKAAAAAAPMPSTTPPV